MVDRLERLEVQLAQAKEERIRAGNGVKLSLAALNTAIGTNLVAAAGLPAGVEPPPTRPPPPRADWSSW